MIDFISLQLPSIVLALVIWTFLSIALLSYLRISKKGSSLLKYHLSAAALISLPLGLIASLFINISFLPALGNVSGLVDAVYSFELPAVTIGADGTVNQAEAVASTQSTWGFSHFFAGIIGLLILIGWSRLMYIFLPVRKMVSAAKPVDRTEIHELLDILKKQNGIATNISLLESNAVSVPFTIGFSKPVIVLPKVDNQSIESIKLILDHELVHISRFDYLIHIFELFVRHTFWMHPIVHLLYHESGYWRETSCDRTVLRQADRQVSDYAQLLYNFAVSANDKPVFRAAMAQEKNLIKRIKALQLINQHTNKEITMKKSILSAGVAVLLIGGLMACSDLTQNPNVDGSEITEVVVNGQTVSTADLVGVLEDDLERVEAELNEMREQGLPSNMVNPLEDHAETLRNVLVLAKSGNISRLVDEDGNFMMLSPRPPRPPVPGTPTSSDADVFMVVEQMPEIIGGQRSLYENLVYPDIARRAGIEGRAIIQFIVDESGNVIDPQIVRSAGGGGLDEAALHAISSSKFTPGMQRGRAVRVQMTQPIIFRLGPDNSGEEVPAGAAVVSGYRN